MARTKTHSKSRARYLRPGYWTKSLGREGRRLVGHAIRGRRLFVNRQKLHQVAYLNLGCGTKTRPDFINLDRKWRPGIDVCWDIVQKPYPFVTDSLAGIYTEHCLEHLSFAACRQNLAECDRVLQPGGVLRIVVPDGELYLDRYQRRKRDSNITLPFANGEYSAMYSINRIMRGFGHQFIYDFETLARLLADSSFDAIRRECFAKGRDARLLIDSREREPESLYVEASKTTITTNCPSASLSFAGTSP